MEFWAPPAWCTLHVFCATYDQKYISNNDMTQWLLSFFKLLCCLKCRENAKKELIKMPFEKYMENNRTLFLWSWTLHDSVNRRLVKEGQEKLNIKTYEEAKDYYFSNITDSRIYHCIWRTIHSFALTCQETQGNEYKKWVELTNKICYASVFRGKWQETCMKALKDPDVLNIDKCLSNGKDLFQWSYKYHKAMNKQLNKQNTNYELVKKTYFDALEPDTIGTENCKSCSV